MDKLYTCAVLIDSKIWAWKVSYTPWESWHNATMRLPMPEGKVELQIKEFTFETGNSFDIFGKSAPEWFSQWEIHPQFKGNLPYKKVEVKKRTPDGLEYRYLEVRNG
jgi:hypothetical protein